jgi:four helix bundle protein
MRVEVDQSMKIVMDDKNYLKIGDISAYTISYNLGNKVWETVSKWDYFAKDTVGKQLARSVDSISANIAEGFGRFHKKDRIKFYYNARGSVFEAQCWLKKAKDRGLVSGEEFEEILSELRRLPKEINQLIKFTNFNGLHRNNLHQRLTVSFNNGFNFSESD